MPLKLLTGPSLHLVLLWFLSRIALHDRAGVLTGVADNSLHE